MTSLIFQSLVNALVFGVILALISSGLTLIFGIMNLVNFAHGELYMLGAYVFWFVYARNTILAEVHPLIKYILGIIAAVVVVVIIGLFIEKFILRRFTGQFLPAAQTCIGLILILQTAALLIFGTRFVSVGSPFVGQLNLGGLTLSIDRLVVMLIGFALIIGLWAFLKMAKMGRAMRAVAQDVEAAALQGIDVGRISALAFALSAGLAAAAGALVTPLFYVDPWIGGSWLMLAFAVTVVGGTGSIPGALVASLIAGFIQSFGSAFLSPTVAYAMIFGLMVIFLIVRPKGIWGHA
jgi:branched-chain amino acid transport system permease protein